MFDPERTNALRCFGDRGLIGCAGEGLHMSDGSPLSVPVEVKFVLGEGALGVGDVTFRLGDETIDLPGACYGTDVVGDVLRLVLAVVTGGPSAECLFDLEPGYFRLSVKRLLWDPAVVELLVERGHQLGPTADDLHWSSYGSSKCRADDLARAVERAAADVSKAKSPLTYPELWGRAFPFRALAALRAAVALPQPRFTWGPEFPDDEIVGRADFVPSDPDGP
jgi:hypothetical protein